MYHPRGGQSLAIAVMLSALGAFGCHRKQPEVVCHVTYGGEAKRFSFPATESPYTESAVDVAGRFAVKAIYIRAPWRAASINVYAYQRTSNGDTLLQESKYLPPFSNGAEARYGFTGRLLVYSRDQRELDYWCELSR